MKAVFDAFHFVSAGLVDGVSFSFVLHKGIQTKAKYLQIKPPSSKIFLKHFLATLIHKTWGARQSEQFF